MTTLAALSPAPPARTPALAEVRRAVGRLWSASPALTAVGLAHVALAAVLLVALAVDGRTLGGAPLWMKPLKFAVSVAAYTLTLAYLMAWAGVRGRGARWAAAGVAGALAVEIVVVVGQAARGIHSHFNVATPLDAALWTVMGVSIVGLWALTAVVAVAVARRPGVEPTARAAVRWGLALTLAGAALGFFMTTPTADQLARVRATGEMPAAGAHTVGGPDGGPGLPVTGWSTRHGDVRVPHFVGLHALQALPLLGWLVGRRVRSVRRQVRAVHVAGLAYAGLLALLLAQALGGESVVAPGPETLQALAGWVGLVAVGALWVLRAPETGAAR